MVFDTTNSYYMMEQSLHFLWTKQSAILDNIANVETPNYKTKYVTFEETLHERLAAAADGSKSAARAALEEVSPLMHEAENESTRADGNGVDLAEQSMELSRNALQMQYVMTSISSDYTTLQSAIRG